MKSGVESLERHDGRSAGNVLISQRRRDYCDEERQSVCALMKGADSDIVVVENNGQLQLDIPLRGRVGIICRTGRIAGRIYI